MATYKERMEYILGWYRDSSVLVTVGEDKKAQAYLPHIEYFRKYYGYVNVQKSPHNLLAALNGGEKPQFIFLEDRFFGGFQGMIEKTRQIVGSYDDPPCIVFLCGDSIQFISKSVKTKVPRLKKSAVFIKPLRSVTLHAYLLSYVHRHLEKEQMGKNQLPLSEWMKHYAQAMVSDNPVKLDTLFAMAQKRR